jgi:hypothetical protein
MPARKCVPFIMKHINIKKPENLYVKGFRAFILERDTGVGPASSAWEADALPMC